MGIFKLSRKDQEVAQLISKNRVDFKFDQSGGKNRLLAEIQEHQISLAAERIRKITMRSFVYRHKWSLALATVLVLVSSTATAFVQADIAKPGDALYPLDQFQEKLMLKLPWPALRRANLQADIINERNQELEYLLNLQDQSQIKNQAVMNSVQNLDNAIENIRAVQDQLTSDGKTEQAERLNLVLERLDKLADEQANKIQSFVQRENDETLKREFNNSLEGIKKSRSRIKR